MKSFLSLLLALSMLIGMLPAISAADTNLTIKYDISDAMKSLAMSSASDTKPLTLINQSATKGFFSFFGAVGNLVYGDTMRYRAYGLEFYKTVAPAFELHIPRAGIYKMNIYANRGGDGRVVNVYMKKDATSIDSADMVGTYDCNKTADDTQFGDDKYVLQTVKNGADDALIEITEAGDYVFTFLATNMFGTLAGIELIETTGSSVPVFMSATLGDVTDGTAEVTGGYMSDGSSADLSGATVTYASSKPEIATIDPSTGIITNVSEGKTEISATVTLPNGEKAVARAEYEFIDGLLLKYSIVNVMREQAMTWGKLDKPLTLINNDTTKGFFDFYDSIGVPAYAQNIKYRGGIEFSSTIAPAFRLYIPSPGEYTMKVYANRGVDGRVVDVYMTNDKASTETADKIGTYDCNQITGDTSFTDEKYLLQPVKNGNKDVVINITEAGEYVFTFGIASMWGTIGGIELINTSVSSDPVCMRPSINILGGKAQITSCYMSDGSKADLTGATYAFASSNPDVATIDPITGVVTDMGEGDTEITATVTLADGTVVIAKTIYHFSKRRTIKYDLLGYMKVAGMTWGSSVELGSLTYAFTGNSFMFFESNLDGESHTASTQQLLRYRDSGIQYYKSYIAFEVYIPQGGTYTMNMYNGISTSGSETHVFVKEREATTDPQYYVGQYTSRDANGDAYATPITVPNVIEGIEIPKAGNYVITFYAPNGTSGIGSFELSVEVNCIKKVEVSAARTELLHNETEQLNISATRWDGTPMEAGEYNITYESSDEKTVTVNKNGVVKAVGDGTATITVTAWDEIETVKSVINITAIDNTEVLEVFIEGSEKLYLGGKAKLGLVAMMESGNKLYMPKADIIYTYSENGIASVDKEGLIYAEGEGNVTVTAEYDFHGKALSASKTFNVSLHPGKKEATLFTNEMREAAKENVKKYDWAKSEVKRVTARADSDVANADKIYNMIIGEGVPRACKVGEPNDPNQDKCQYCGVLVTTLSGGWNIDPLNRPWKIQCPGCKRLFPSNDFELLLERGLDEKGYYDRERAIAANAEAVANGEKNALVNELYPEIGDKDENGNYKVTSLNVGRGLRSGETVSGWGVDDGFGYVPRDENGNPFRPATSTGGVYYYNGHIVEERHNYIAMYLHDTWDIIETTINYLADAYTYTGDIKYGRAGAKILDRIADVYPSYDLTPYFYETSNYHGGGNAGKIQGRITEAYIAISLGEATDKLWPALTDNEVINFLSAKAEEMGLENDKSSTAKIWENWENGILYENYDAAKHEMNSGNFGMVQNVVAVTAIALDREPHTTEMIDWIYNTSEKLEDGTVTGGNVDYQLINEVDRDGMGYEVGPQYNQMWISYLEGMANALSKYKGEGTYNPYKHPKFAMMFLPYDVINLTNSHHAQIGDSGALASVNYASQIDMHITGFKLIEDKNMKKRLARYIYLRNGNTTEGLKYGIFDRDPERIQEEIERYIDEDEVYLESDMLAGYGFAVLRAGKNYTSASSATAKNAMRDFWMYFGINGTAHAHQDLLNIGMEAYGLNLSPDLGYPETTGSDPNRWQWVMATVSHNTVVVDERSQDSNSTNVSEPLHFDETENVKLIDVSSPDAYKQTEEYRRTMVMVKASDDVSYGVDFFRVIGGDKHTFSFHAQSENATYINETKMVKQVDENGEYEGTYAGRNVEYGSDPNGNSSPKYPRGYTWMTKVRQDMAPGKDFAVDFAITDYRKAVPDNKNVRLRMTQINDFDLSEVAIVGGDTLKKKPENKEMPETLEYVLAHRRGKGLDSLFTTVYEPYKGERYIESIEQIGVTTDESVGEKDAARAVKVTHTNGRADYIVYATNNSVVYNVADVFDFRGFVGVYSVNKDGEVIYKYVNDGDIIDGTTEKTAAFDGVVFDFQRDLAFDNYIDVEINCEDTSELVGKFVFIDNERKQNAAYRINGVEPLEGGKLRLDIGNVSLISGHKDVNDIDSGYVYNISSENTFTVPRSYSVDYLPVVANVENTTVSAGSSISVAVSAEAFDGGSIRYIGTVLPRGASVDSESGKVTWKPDSSQIGENHFEITAEDASGRQSAVHFYITVYGSTTGGYSSDKTDGENKTEAPSAGGGGGGGGGAAAPTPDDSSDNTDVPGDEDTTQSNEKDNADGTDNTDVGTYVPDCPDFTDLTNHAWAADAINALAADGIIKGTTASTFAPANNITRADFALLLVRAFNLTSENTENFADVSASDYFAPELAIARNTGLVNGIGDNRYAPLGTITRQDMMVIVYRALQTLNVGVSIYDEPQNDDFTTVAEYAKPAVTALIGAGLVNGKNGRIAPTDYTTRAEVAVLIKRILDYVK